MKKINWFLAAIFAFAALSVQAQEKMLTIDAIYGTEPGQRVAFSGRLTPLQWNRDGSLRQVKRGETGLEVYRFNALTGEAVPFYDKSKFEAAIVPFGIKAEEARNIANQPNYTYNSEENAIVFTSGNDLFYYNFATGSGKRPDKQRRRRTRSRFSPDGKTVSFVRGRIFSSLMWRAAGNAVDKDGSDKFSMVISLVLRRRTLRARQQRGYFWSPDSKYIAFLRTDESPCRNSFSDDTANDQKIENTDYPASRRPKPVGNLGIANVQKSEPKFVALVEIQAGNFLISRVAWSPDSKRSCFQAQNREQTF